jgi:tetratricopeptide (TPR) repeat protein
MAQTQMGRVQSISGARKEGLAKLRRSVEQLRPIVAAAPTHFAYRRNLLFTLRALADQLRGPEGSEGRDLDGALRAIEEAEKLAAAAAAADPGNQLAARDVAVTASFAARIHKGRHDWKAAGLALERAARSMQQILDRYPGDRSAVDSLGYYQSELGEGAKLRGDYVQAEAHFRRAIGIYRALLASGSQDRYHRFNIALASRSLGECLNAQGRAGGAVHYEQALSILGALRAADPATTMFQSEWEKTSNLHRERVSR